MAYWII